ncbi:MAG: HAD-IIB family hydrolase [Nitrospinota bacterium]
MRKDEVKGTSNPGGMEARENSATLILVSDVDATLLHEETYDCGEVQPLLQFLGQKGIPLILASSKTRREMDVVQGALGLRGPFICENGGAVVIPLGGFSKAVPGAVTEGDKEVIELGRPVRMLQDALGRMAEEIGLRVRTLPEMDVDEVADLTGLPSEQAALARKREYALPFLFEGPEGGLGELRRKAERSGLRVTRGGRLFHLMGDTDKGKAFSRLRELYESSGPSLFVVALGDAENDLSLLREADQPIVIPKKSGWDPQLADLPAVRLASRPAPEGWVDEVKAILEERGFHLP